MLFWSYILTMFSAKQNPEHAPWILLTVIPSFLQSSLSNTIVAWILSPPRNPLDPEDVVEIVWSLYPLAACLLISACRFVRLAVPEPVPSSFSVSTTWITTYLSLRPPAAFPATSSHAITFPFLPQTGADSLVEGSTV